MSLCPIIERYIQGLGVGGFRVRDTDDPATGVLIDDTNNSGRKSQFLHAIEMLPESDGQLRASTRHKIDAFVIPR